MTALTVRLPDDLYEQLRSRAFETRIPMSRIVSQAIEAALRIDLTRIEPGPCYGPDCDHISHRRGPGYA